MIRLLALLAVVVAIGACAHPASPAAPAAELTPALRPLAWWLGTWRATDRDPGTESWIANAGAIYGIALHDASFELLIVDDAGKGGPADGVLRIYAMPQHHGVSELDAVGTPRGSQIAFEPAAPAPGETPHGPNAIAYARDGDQLAATIAFTGRTEVYHFAATAPLARAPELEAADRAFAKAALDRGADGWVDAFDPEGAMGRASGKIVGAAAIHDAMAPLLAAGVLAWEPIASGQRGDLGFTVGKATYEPTSKDPADRFRSSYATIWRRQKDGSWKVLFDAGRAVNE